MVKRHIRQYTSNMRESLTLGLLLTLILNDFDALFSERYNTYSL